MHGIFKDLRNLNIKGPLSLKAATETRCICGETDGLLSFPPPSPVDMGWKQSLDLEWLGGVKDMRSHC